MRKKNNYFKMVCVCVFILTGCSNNRSTEVKIFMEGEKEELEEEKMEEAEMESSSDFIKVDTEDSTESIVMEPEIVDADWSEYFNGLNGEAVVYDISNRRYTTVIPYAGSTKWKDMMQKELDKLQYGNCDISDWEGRLNTNNNNRALTGFWIESSLMISPKEQVEVMERIFGDNSDYSEETQNELKQVMLVSEQERTDISIYGKTGMGKAEGVVVDAWFTGFAEGAEGKVYFCVHLGRTDGMNVSSPLAKEIAIQIVSDYYGQ